MYILVKENDLKNNFGVHVKVWVQSKAICRSSSVQEDLEEEEQGKVVGQVKEKGERNMLLAEE